MLHSVFPGCRFVFYRCERVCSSPNSIGRPSLYADSQDLNKALLLSSCPNKCSASQFPLLSLASKVLTARQPSVPIFKSSFSRSTRHSALLEKKKPLQSPRHVEDSLTITAIPPIYLIIPTPLCATAFKFSTPGSSFSQA